MSVFEKLDPEAQRKEKEAGDYDGLDKQDAQNY